MAYMKLLEREAPVGIPADVSENRRTE